MVEKKEKVEGVMSPLIGTVMICGNEFRIYLVDWKLNSKVYGHMSSPEDKIYLSTISSPKNMLITLIHEMMHKIFGEYMLKGQSDIGSIDLDEEKVIETFDSPIVNDVMLNKHNQVLFKRILDGEFEKKRGE